MDGDAGAVTSVVVPAAALAGSCLVLPQQGHPIRYQQVHPKHFLLCQILDLPLALPMLQKLLLLLLLLLLVLWQTPAVLVARALWQGQVPVEATWHPQQSRCRQVEQCHLSKPTQCHCWRRCSAPVRGSGS